MSTELVPRIPNMDFNDNEEEVKAAMIKLADVLWLDVLPKEYLEWVVNTCGTWMESRTIEFTDEMAMDPSNFPGSEKLELGAGSVSCFDTFIERFRRTPVFAKVVYSVMRSAVNELKQADENGTIVLKGTEAWDRKADADIMKVKSVRLSPLKSKDSSTSCNVEFFDSCKQMRRIVSTGSLGIMYEPNLGELGNYVTSEEKQKRIQIYGSDAYEERLGTTDMNNAAYSLVLNGIYNPLNGPSRMAKMGLIAIVIDSLFFYHAAISFMPHPCFKECHDSGGRLNVDRFVAGFVKRFRGRYGTADVAGAAGVHQKLKLPINGKPRCPQIKMKSYISFNTSIGFTEKNDSGLNHVSQWAKNTFLENADTDRQYRNLPIADLVALNPKPMDAEKRSSIKNGDLARVSFNVVCRSSFKDTPTNRFLVLYCPVALDVTRRRLFDDPVSDSNAVDEFYNRPAIESPETIVAVVEGMMKRESLTYAEACDSVGIAHGVYQEALEIVEVARLEAKAYGKPIECPVVVEEKEDIAVQEEENVVVAMDNGNSEDNVDNGDEDADKENIPPNGKRACNSDEGKRKKKRSKLFLNLQNITSE